MYLRTLLFLFFFSLLQFSRVTTVHAISPVEFGPSTTKIDLSSHIEIEKDPSHSLTITDIISDRTSINFQPVSKTGNSFGFSRSAYWVHFSLHVDQSLQDSILLELNTPLIDKVSLFVPDGQKGFIEKITGDATPFSTRDLQLRTFLFRLPEFRGTTSDYYLRLESKGSIQIPLSLWSSSAFIESVDRINIILGGYYGIMLLLMLSAFVSYIMIRDRIFLFYSLYLLSYLLLQLSLNGFSYQYLWPDLPWLTSRVTSASIGLVVICGLLFTASFLQIWGTRHPRVKVLFSVLIACGLVGIVMSFWGNYALAVRISTVVGAFLPPIVLIAIFSSLASGYRPAKYFLLAWCVFLLGVFIAGLLYLGIVPHTFLTLYAMQIGSTFEIILLGFALMDRINLLRLAKENATEQANAYLQQLNEELETLVSERTHELQEQNRRLNELAVQDTMTGLLNHNASMDCLKHMQNFARRYEKNLAVVMLDIDQFKAINDKYGHQAGDQVIMAIANVLIDTIRDSDSCGRYGGEEFILILPESNSNDAGELAERTRTNILKLNIPEIDGTPVTASFGIAVFDSSHPDSDLIALADNALYKAKRNGRNQVFLLAESNNPI